MEKYIIAPPAGSQTNAIGAKDRPWEEVHAKRYPGLNEYLAESTGYGIVSGCEPSISGLTVKVGAGVIHLADGTRKEIVQTNITLDAADPTNPRIDLVYIDSTGTVAKITGTAASPSVPALPSSGISVAQVSVAAGATTGTVTDSRGMLARYYNTGIVSVKDFGAVGDGTHDDTQAIQAALDSGGCVYLPKGTYVISDTININIEKASLNGAGGDTVIKAADTFPSGKFMLLFFSTSLYYLDRYKFINKHGNFSLRGIDAKWVNDYRSYDYKVKGIKIGGNINTEYEGQVDCQLFENIVFDYLYTCIELGSHEYKNTFLNLIFNWARYSVTSAADSTDSGEANAFIDCSFWQRIHVSKTGMFFYSCTIHFNAWAWADEPYGHYLCDGGYRFTNCHFEWGNGDNEVYSRLIYTIGSRISISDCEFVFNSKAKYRDYFFYAANTGYITIENCNSFIQYLVSTDNTPVCNSCVYLKGLTYWYRQNDDGYHVDIHKTCHYFLPKSSLFKEFSDIYYLDGVDKSKTTLTQNSDKSVTVNLARFNHNTAMTGIYKRACVNGHKSLRVVLDLIGITVGTQYQISADNIKTPENHIDATFEYGLVFADASGDPVSVRLPTIVYAAKTIEQANGEFSYDYTLPIPPAAEYVYYGVGLNDGLHDNVQFTIKKCYIEMA